MIQVAPLTPAYVNLATHFVQQGSHSGANPFVPFKPRPFFFGLDVELYLAFTGGAGLKQHVWPITYMLLNHAPGSTLAGLLQLKRDSYLKERCLLSHLCFNEDTDIDTRTLFLNQLFAYAHNEGIRCLVTYVSHTAPELMELLKYLGFHQAMAREHFALTAPPQPEFLSTRTYDPPNVGRATAAPPILLQHGWRRLTPAYIPLVTDYYNEQLPSLWRSALERRTGHFVNESQHHGRPVERWWMAHPQRPEVDTCHFLLELVHPSAYSPWQINLFHHPAQADVDFTAFLGRIVEYCQAIHPKAGAVLCAWGYQTHLRHLAHAQYQHLPEKDVSLLIRDDKLKCTGGLQQRLQKSLLHLEGNAGGGLTAPI
jgi:hypothetical protein